jgi:type I restriction enzyme S subunit
MMMPTEKQKLPEGWKWVKLGEVCRTTSGGTPDRGDVTYYNGSIPWIKSGELKDGYIESVEERITERGLKSSSAKIIPSGTLMIAMYGANVGKLGISKCDAATNQAVCSIFTSDQIDQLFLFSFLLHYRDRLLLDSFGGAQPNISQTLIPITIN